MIDYNKKANGKCIKISSIILAVFIFMLVVILSVGLTVDMHVYNSTFHQYSINLCDPNQCSPVDETSDPISVINKANHVTHPLCSYALANAMVGTCILPALSLQNASICVVHCDNESNDVSCQLSNCVAIYNCIDYDDNIVYQRSGSIITLLYGENYYLIINGTKVLANHFVNNEYCIEYGSITDTLFNLYIQTIIENPPYYVNGTCIITINNSKTNNSTFTTNYYYGIRNLTAGQTECDPQTLILCLHEKNLCESPCDSIKNYHVHDAIIVILCVFGTILGVYSLFYLIAVLSYCIE